MNLVTSTFSNAFTNILRNKLINFVSFGIIAFTLLIFGIFNYLTYSLDVFTRSFSRNIEAVFYLKDDVEQTEIDILIRELEENLLVKQVVYKSKNQAEIEFARRYPELEYALSEFKDSPSPLPASIEVTFKQEQNIDVKINSLIEEIAKLEVVESKEVNLDWARQVTSIKKFISAVGIFLSLILIFISCFIIFNVIKLNIFYRKEEIHIFKLVGAQDWYIRFPFIIEGALLGFLGSVMAGILLFVSLKLFPAYATFMLSIVKGMIDFENIPLNIFIRLVLLGTGIGLISSYLSLRQFLKSSGAGQ
ncbi:MAG: permease-like cell division protein FtsX [Candidatus Aminicenantes bacterium]|nr:permease-like cell division protein FtsX [Candidatus Aminicenantes bacterium]